MVEQLPSSLSNNLGIILGFSISVINTLNPTHQLSAKHILNPSTSLHAHSYHSFQASGTIHWTPAVTSYLSLLPVLPFHSH